MEEQDHPPIPESFIYETIAPLSLSAADDGAPPLSEQFEPYSVFRNEISLSELPCASPDSAAPDFFSLDVAAEASGWESLPPPVTVAEEPTTPALAPESKLESSWFRGNCKGTPMLQLHKEIVDFCEFLSPTPEEKAARDLAIESVFEVIKYIWPHCQVEVFGSFRTGLYLPTSDIDVVILRSGLPNPQIGLNALSRALSQRSMAKKMQVIGKARVPIIKFVEKKSGLAFDVSFDIDNGPKAAEYIQEAVAKWPQLRPLCLILKVFLQQRELNEVYSGGIGSYALLTMILAMLRRNIRESQVSAEDNLGVLLVHFFDFYGRKLNTSDVGVSCDGEGSFFIKRKKGFLNKGRPSLIGIEDPQEPENDIGKSSFNYFQVRSAFALAYTTLTNPKIIMSLGPNRSILGTIIRPDPVLLERKGGLNGEVTFDRLLPGAGEPLQHQYGDQDMLCNWQFDYEEEPLPRGNDSNAEPSTCSLMKRRKSASKEKSSLRKLKENGDSNVRYNGQFDYEEEPLPRSAEPSTCSSTKKRKSSKKLKENGESSKVRNEENGWWKENGIKKKHWRKPW